MNEQNAPTLDTKHAANGHANGHAKLSGASSIPDGLRMMEHTAGRMPADTLRLWEFYREQASMWRALAILQMPATSIAFILALVMFFFADTTLEFPAKPLPGRYSVRQLPDEEFINFSKALISLMTTFQPTTAKIQFLQAQKLLWEPALSQFQTTMLRQELPGIEESRRSQVFFIDEGLVKVDRIEGDEKVIVRLPGVRQKMIGEKALDAEDMIFYIKMTTIPRNRENEFGIVAVDVRFEIKGRRDVIRQDTKDRRRLKEAMKIKSSQGN